MAILQHSTNGTLQHSTNGGGGSLSNFFLNFRDHNIERLPKWLSFSFIFFFFYFLGFFLMNQIEYFHSIRLPIVKRLLKVSVTLPYVHLITLNFGEFANCTDGYGRDCMTSGVIEIQKVKRYIK